MINIKQLFHSNLDQDELIALSWKIPLELNVNISEDSGEYIARITNFENDNIVTQAKTGQELVEMVNSALYAYLDLPAKYMDRIGFFMPPPDIRDELKVKIPSKYLNTNVGLVKA